MHNSRPPLDRLFVLCGPMIFQTGRLSRIHRTRTSNRDSYRCQSENGQLNNIFSSGNQVTVGCRQAKMFRHGPDKQLARYALGLKKTRPQDIGWPTYGPHCAYNRHLTVMKIHANPLCTACGEETETMHISLFGKMLCQYTYTYINTSDL